jgi:hypothetical protein
MTASTLPERSISGAAGVGAGSGSGLRRGAPNAGPVAMAAEAARNDRRLKRFMVCGGSAFG